jgi:molecular chaperone DnaK (HSP70)
MQLGQQLDSTQALSAQQADEMRKQAEMLRKQLKSKDFKIDPKQMEQFRNQMEEFRKSLGTGDFKLDPKQMDEFRHQMEQWRQQLEQMRGLQFDNYV